QVMNDTAGKSVNTSLSDKGTERFDTSAKKAESNDSNSQSTETVKEQDTAVGGQEQESETQETGKTEDVQNGEEITEKVSDAANEIKDAIKDKFGVTDEEIEAAMETLGLSIQDLLNPDAIKELVLDLSGTEDSLSLLTNADLYDSMKEIMQMAADAATEIKSEFSLTDGQFMQLLNDGDLTEGIDLKEMLSEDTGDVLQPAEEDLMQPRAETEATMDTADTADTTETAAAPVVKVYAERTEETRTSDPTGETITDSGRNEKELTVSEASQENAADNQSDEQSSELFGQMTQTTTTTNNVGDVVETVKQFAQSYVNGEEVMQQVTDYIKVNISPDTTSMEMQLHPESLGTVNMQITSQNGVVTAQLLVQNEAVKAVLETQLIQLQETFEQQGQKVEAVEVAVADYNLDKGLNDNSEEQSEKQKSIKLLENS
ncbi:MAG TPA: flagellar hook-length control protein FliK, partial [Lachnospiraceae bacterium]|nr:flagellar hook-length control protein FliK [Lachnospiraceae bacterium]